MNSSSTTWYRATTFTLLIFIFVILLFPVRWITPSHIYTAGHKHEASMRHSCQDSLPITSRTFGQMPVLEDLSRGNDGAWLAALMPRREGFIMVRHNETYQLKMGISMFHALHCLTLVRAMLQDALDGHDQGSRHASRPSHPANGSAERFLHHTHVPHCLGYIAQSIICSGDDTIERPWLRRDDAGNIIQQGVDGKGVEHQCRDTALLWNVAQASEKRPLEQWAWQAGDTVTSVFKPDHHGF